MLVTSLTMLFSVSCVSSFCLADMLLLTSNQKTGKTVFVFFMMNENPKYVATLNNSLKIPLIANELLIWLLSSTQCGTV